QQLVTGLVAEAVVDALEVVDIHQQQALRLLGIAREALFQAADERGTVAQVGQIVGIGQALDALLRQLGFGDVFVDADVMGQLAIVAIHLGDRQVAPVRLLILASAAKLALPAAVFGQAGVGIEQQVAEVGQSRQLRQAMAADLVAAVQGNGGEAGIDVLHPAVAVDQQEGAGTLFDRALEEVQRMGDRALLLVDQYLGELIGQLAGEGDLVGLPGTLGADVLEAENTDHFAFDADAGIEHRGDPQRLQITGCQFARARIVLGIMGIDRPAAVQGFQIMREIAGIDRWQLLVSVQIAPVQRYGLEAVAAQLPDPGTGYAVDLAGCPGNQLGGFLARRVGDIALTRQAYDQLLLGVRAGQMLQVVVLGTLVLLQGRAQVLVLDLQIQLARGEGIEAVIGDQQIAT